jgi:hypothetical protein
MVLHHHKRRGGLPDLSLNESHRFTGPAIGVTLTRIHQQRRFTMKKFSLIASALSLVLLVGCAMPEKKDSNMMMDTEKMDETQEMMMDEGGKKMMKDDMNDTM